MIDYWKIEEDNAKITILFESLANLLLSILRPEVYRQYVADKEMKEKQQKITIKEEFVNQNDIESVKEFFNTLNKLRNKEKK